MILQKYHPYHKKIHKYETLTSEGILPFALSHVIKLAKFTLVKFLLLKSHLRKRQKPVKNMKMNK